MSKDSNGGPAFPTGTWEYDGQGNVLPYQEPGMTLRQYIAIKVVQGIYANPYRTGTSYDAARTAFEVADAMLVVSKE